jgi:molybdopterin synthase sulfur carrier subunit
MATVRIPSLMRDLTDGRASVEVPGRTVRQVFDALEAAYPGVKARLIEDGMLRPDYSVAVDGETAELGLLQPVAEHSEVIIVPAISGG